MGREDQIKMVIVAMDKSRQNWYIYFKAKSEGLRKKLNMMFENKWNQS